VVKGITKMEERRMERDTAPLACSVGIMAYNEAANIARAIETILGQESAEGYVAELIIVASGCTDQTIPIVADLARKDARIRLIVQESREGKASAINLFLAAARSPIILMSSADVLVKVGTIDALLRHFHDPTVGMVGGRPIPVNDEGTFLGFAVHLLWGLHDRVAREEPKLGEVVAFRNMVPSIPSDSPVDEISIQAFITQLGYRLVYEPQAVIYNRGPATVGDFVRQRRRIYAGHLLVRQQQGYVASTMSVGRVGRALLATHPFVTPRAGWWTIGTVGLEAAARGLGRYDYLRRKPHHVWQMAVTTKWRISGTAATEGQQSVLVFRITDFHRYLLELGPRASQQLTQQVMHHMNKVLGPEGMVTGKGGGTIIVVVPGGRDETEPLAQQLIDSTAATSLRCNGHRDIAGVKLACGLIAFSQTGQAVSLSIPAAV
jgi:hypothetical protein